MHANMSRLYMTQVCISSGLMGGPRSSYPQALEVLTSLQVCQGRLRHIVRLRSC